MPEDPSLAEKMKLPELLASIIGSLLLTPLIAYVCLHALRKAPPGWLKEAAPKLAFALAVVLIFLVSKISHRYATRKRRIALEPKGTRLAIYVANLGDGQESHDAYQHVVASIRESFSAEHVEVLPAGRAFHLAEGVSEDEVALQPAKEARAFLARHNGDLLLWGRLHKLDGKTRIELRFVTAAQDAAASDRQIYSLTEKLTLDPTFGPEMGATLAALIASQADPAHASGQYVVTILKPIVARLQPFADRPPASMRSADRGKLLHAYATIQSTIGEQSGDSHCLEIAVVTFRKALANLSREEVPLDWAKAQNNLGLALHALGERESDNTRLLEAIDAYQKALLERTRELVPLKWAMTQNNLGNTFKTLGELESGTNRFLEAVAAYRNALLESTRERVPLEWAMTQNNLGIALRNLGERESVTNHILEAVEAYNSALLESSRESAPLNWAGTQNNLGVALAALGERESSIERILQAVEAYRNALIERTRERVPVDWAITQENLGEALMAIGKRESGIGRLLESRQACQNALEVYSETAPSYQSITKRNLDNLNALIAARSSNPNEPSASLPS